MSVYDNRTMNDIALTECERERIDRLGKMFGCTVEDRPGTRTALTQMM